MKTKYIISAAVACLLLTGCAATESHSPNVQYSDLFNPKNASNASPQMNGINGKAAAPTADNTAETDEDRAAATNGGSAVSVSRSANAAANGNDTSDSGDRYVLGPEDEPTAIADTPNVKASSNENTSAAETTPNTGSDASSKKINNPRPASVIYTDSQAVADLQFGDICYFAYKTADKDMTESEDTTDNENNSENEDEQEDGDKQESKPKPQIKYDHGYRVVFRTNTDTYLLGISPYGQCSWDDVNDTCLKISDLIEADCQMVGIPSLEDLQYFTDCGIYLPGQYEMWTSTLANTKGNKVYFRNKKGAFYSTKSKTDRCGVCAIIRISSPKNDPELLSSSLSNYEEAKARLEAEEEQYKLAISEE